MIRLAVGKTVYSDKKLRISEDATLTPGGAVSRLANAGLSTPRTEVSFFSGKSIDVVQHSWVEQEATRLALAGDDDHEMLPVFAMVAFTRWLSGYNLPGWVSDYLWRHHETWGRAVQQHDAVQELLRRSPMIPLALLLSAGVWPADIMLRANTWHDCATAAQLIIDGEDSDDVLALLNS